MSEEKKKYKVIQPVAFGGRREVGEILELTDEEANALGSEFVEAYTPEESAEQNSAENSEQAESNTAAPESQPATAGESLESNEEDSEQ